MKEILRKKKRNLSVFVFLKRKKQLNTKNIMWLMIVSMGGGGVKV